MTRRQRLSKPTTQWASTSSLRGLSETDNVELFNAAPSGHKVKFKDAYSAMLKQAEEIIDAVADALRAAVEANDEILLQETVSELTSYERRTAFERLNGEEQEAVINMRKKA